MYYSMKRLFFDDSVAIDAASHFEYSLSLGQRLPADLPVPLLFEIDTDLSGGRLPSAFLRECVFSRRLLDALSRAGVDNIDSYPVLIRNPETGESLDGYLAANVLGRISCVDLGASEYEVLAHSHVFRRLVIDPRRTLGLYLFRLHENSQTLLVKDSVVQRLPRESFPDIHFEPVEEC